jgi:hypothetical protein
VIWRFRDWEIVPFFSFRFSLSFSCSSLAPQENTDAFAAKTCDVLRHAAGAADQVPLRAREMA